jgi:hypothetical protein
MRFLAGVILIGMLPVAHGVMADGSVEDEQWPSQFAAVEGLHGFELDEVSGLRDNVSVLIGSDSNGQKICTSTSSAGCASSAGYSFRAVLGPCTSLVTIDCIESVVATKADGTAVNGTFKQVYPMVDHQVCGQWLALRMPLAPITKSLWN